MYECDHPHVLKLLGVCLDEGLVPYIITPFMANGSLLSHLKEERKILVLDPETANHEDAVSSNSVVKFHFFFFSITVTSIDCMT